MLTFALRNIGAKYHPSNSNIIAANHSKCPTLNPWTEPAPANPTKCSLDILVANNDAPIANHPKFLPARKYSFIELSLCLETEKPIINTIKKYNKY